MSQVWAQEGCLHALFLLAGKVHFAFEHCTLRFALCTSRSALCVLRLLFFFASCTLCNLLNVLPHFNVILQQSRGLAIGPARLLNGRGFLLAGGALVLTPSVALGLAR